MTTEAKAAAASPPPADASLPLGPPAPDHAKASLASLFVFTKASHLATLIAAILASTAAAGLRTVFAIFLGRIFDIFAAFGSGIRSGDSSVQGVSEWCLLLTGLGLGNWLASASLLSFWIAFGELQAESARRSIFKSLLYRDLAWFDTSERAMSSLLVTVQTQTRELQLATSQVFGLLICDTVSALASLGVALYHSWKLTLVLVATVPVSIIILSHATKRMDPAIRTQKTHLETASKLTSASVSAIKLVKVYDGCDRNVQQYYRAVKRAAGQYLIQAQCNAFQLGYIAFWVVSMFVVGFWYGVVLVQSGLPAGHVLTTFFAILALFQGVESVAPHWLVLSKGMAAGNFLSGIGKKSDSEPPPANAVSAHPRLRPGHKLGGIELRNVSFAYPSRPEKTVLEPSSFMFPAGQTTFVVGKSGSGKSTVANLIARLYKPLTGQILIDGRPADELDRDWLRENITVIQQTSILFNDTLFNNIAPAHPAPELVRYKDVIDACQFALLQSLLAELPNGLDTLVGPGGFDLSGGQKQMIALARARLRDPAVLVLDEITSGLDKLRRGLVMDGIREWRKDKTTIIITHDMAQIEESEYVYVMEDASIVQQGPKSVLSTRNKGAFAVLSGGADEDEDGDDDDDNNVVVQKGVQFSRFSTSDARSSSPTSWSKSCTTLNASNGPESSSRTLLYIPPSIYSESASSWNGVISGLWEPPMPPQKPQLARLTTLIESDLRDFSQFIDDQFSPPDRERSRSRSVGMLSPVLLEGSSLDPFADKDDDNFLFGAANRRSNISVLRRVTTRKRLEESTKAKEPTDQCPPGSSLSATLKTLWPALGVLHKIVCILGSLTCLIGSAATPAFGFCLGHLLSAMWSSGDKAAEGRKWALYLLAIAFVDGICRGGGRYLMEIVAQAWVDNIRVEALKRILQQPISWFDDKSNSPSRISEALERSPEEMRSIVGRFVPIVLTVAGTVSIAVIWAMATSWRLTLVVLAPLPVVFGAVKGYAAVNTKWEAKCNDGAEDSSALATDILLNLRVVRCLTMEDHFTRKYDATVRRTLGLGLRRAAYSGWLFGLYQSMGYMLVALIFYYTMVLLAGGLKREVTQMLQVVNVLVFSIGNASDILSGIPQLTMAQAAATQLLKYASLLLERRGCEQSSRKLHSGPLPVRMRRLTFAYPLQPEEPVLRHVSLDINSGECTAIVGQSGCGKSTVVSLLLGLYDPPPGRRGGGSALTFSHVPHSDVDMQSLRSFVAYVPQSPFIFPSSIADNITYGLAADSEPPSDRLARVMHAAQAVNLHDFIASLPQGYDTIVGDGGLTLSGGQAQRLCIARALIRRPRLLVMDEPTSALDAENAAAVRQIIGDLVRGRSSLCKSPTEISAMPDQADEMAIVLVTHSIDMMHVADKIIVLDDGIKVEEGTSVEELARANGPFSRLMSGGVWVDGDDATR
ncbi:ABC a-pheromone efflux pump AtrD [Purpureocillium lilacinum]|uniref:ABC a-pheromone efflux pump AtrD n=1 Tax=Purpureocillium lilacinum TaxID=33203 RepID=A0A179H778_PURLI|nr:ABC a-pheromone efflux pump AtrD [Purpureocillium lilacinum]OAQ85289.1 ABC a-pheromone efflux pump AtrD [Purpureocillium lilacinum]